MDVHDARRQHYPTGLRYSITTDLYLCGCAELKFTDWSADRPATHPLVHERHAHGTYTARQLLRRASEVIDDILVARVLGMSERGIFDQPTLWEGWQPPAE